MMKGRQRRILKRTRGGEENVNARDACEDEDG